MNQISYNNLSDDSDCGENKILQMKNLFYKIVKFWRHINIMRNTAIHVADCYESYMRRGTWRIRFAEKPMLLHITEASLSFFRENKRKAYNYMGNMYRIIIIVCK